MKIKVLGHYAMQFRGNCCIHLQGKNFDDGMIFRRTGTYTTI